MNDLNQTLRQVIVTPDGTQFDNKQDALNHMRRPKILAALKVATGGNASLADWLLEHRESVEMAFETGTVRRVTKVEGNKLAKALEALKDIKGVPGIAFLQEHADAIKDSFRWPSVKRMDDAEKAFAARNTLIAASEGNEELADWVLEHKSTVLAAYEAGVEKRQVHPNAKAALEKHRAEVAAKKAAAAEAGVVEGADEGASTAE